MKTGKVGQTSLVGKAFHLLNFIYFTSDRQDKQKPIEPIGFLQQATGMVFLFEYTELM
jgi:hypothetical protein